MEHSLGRACLTGRMRYRIAKIAVGLCAIGLFGCRSVRLHPGGRLADCVTAVIGSPCRTIRSHTLILTRGKWGILDGSVFTEEETEAADQNYSFSTTTKDIFRQHWLFRVSRAWGALVISRPDDQILAIDHIHNVFSTRSGARMRGYQNWPMNDPTCNKNPHYLYFEGRTPDDVVSGIRVIGYYWHHKKGHEGRMYFAPSVGCRIMMIRETVRNRFGIPIYYREEKVDSVEFGPPDPHLFQVPNGYKPLPATWKFGDQCDPPGTCPVLQLNFGDAE